MSSERDKAKIELQEWLTERLRYNEVPRLSDARDWVLRTGQSLRLRDVRETMRLHPAYMHNMPQQLMAKRSRMYRPVVVNSLGTWHADIGYFAVNKRYKMPERYRHGYLVAKDVLSRRIYATPLLGSKDASSLVRAFETLFAEHARDLPDVPVQSVAFDQERSVVGRKVQEFLAKRGIAFHAFHMSSSKAKFAEGAIRQIRAVTARLMKLNRRGDTWYKLLPEVVKNLNGQEVTVGGRKLGYAPADIRLSNVEDFKKNLFASAPAYYWAQYDLAPDLVNFKYQVGTVVRAKLLATSSAVLGQKTSESNLTEDLFEITKKVPYVTRKLSVGKAYSCRNLMTGRSEVFQEDEITPGREAEEEDLDERESPAPDEYKRKTRTRGLEQ